LKEESPKESGTMIEVKVEANQAIKNKIKDDEYIPIKVQDSDGLKEFQIHHEELKETITPTVR
jgi:hypothetical protein